MADKTPNEILLDELMELTIRDLIDTIKSGEAGSATLSVARQLLRDNQITCNVVKAPEMGDLVSLLPFSTPESDEPSSANG